MLLFSTEKLCAVLKRSKWSRVFLGLPLLQLILALVFLIPTFINVRTMLHLGFNARKVTSLNEKADELYLKAFKIYGECIMYIAFEVWKLWLAFDGVLHSNSRTIWATALFSMFSFVFSILMIIESVIWMKVDTVFPVLIQALKLSNQNLLIGLSCISFFIVPFTFYSAAKVAKDFGWDVYKKIGSSIKIQKMYVTVQWFSLALKIDIYFEFGAYAFYIFYLWAVGLKHDSFYYIRFYIMLSMLITTIPSLALSRFSISRESKILMILFILFQLLSLANILFVTIIMKDWLTEWYTFAGFCLASLISSIGTIVLAIMCLLNFDKGLKEFVQWKPFSKKIPRAKSATYNNINRIDTFEKLEDQRADEPIDD